MTVRITALLLPTLALTLAACGAGTTPPTSTPLNAANVQGQVSAINTQANTAVVAGATVNLSGAQVTRSGQPVGAGALTVGQQVTVSGAASLGAQATTGAGTTVDIQTAVEGQVSAVDAAAGTITVAGQTITVTADTVIHLQGDRDDQAGTGTLAQITVGAYVEITVQDASAQPLVAASIEVKDERERADDDTVSGVSVLRGTVTNLDLAARTFTVGDVTVTYTADTKIEGTLGADLRVTLQGTYDTATHVMTATHIELNGRHSEGDRDGRLIGVATHVNASAKTFSLRGVSVDYSGAQVTGTLGEGAAVRVEGTLGAGVFTATEVTVRSRAAAPAQGATIRVEGSVTALDTATSTLSVHGLNVLYAGAKVEGTLRVGARVRVTGAVSAQDTATVTASEIKVESESEND